MKIEVTDKALAGETDWWDASGHFLYASLAQLVEPAAYIRVVGGSSPSVCTINNDVYLNNQHQYGDKLCL